MTKYKYIVEGARGAVYGCDTLAEARRMAGVGGHIKKQNPEDYVGEHSAPDAEGGAPMMNVASNGIYPNDFYSGNGFSYYRSYGPDDWETYEKVAEVHNRRFARVKVYRAVPHTKTRAERIDQIETEEAKMMRTGRLPRNVNTRLSMDDYWQGIADERLRLEELGTEEPRKRLKINPGDWVTISRAYAVEHGRSNLNNEYKIITKTVPANQLYTDGNSLYEWGWVPKSIKKNPSDILFHRTSPYAATKILESDTFLPTAAFGTDLERNLNRGKMYHLSTMRTPTGVYSERVTFQIDGRELSNTYKIIPVDYWAKSGGKAYKHEAEDRVVTDRPFIRQASKYIQSIHISLPLLAYNSKKPEKYRSGKMDEILKVEDLAKAHGLPVYIYPDTSSYNILNKRKAFTSLGAWKAKHKGLGGEIEEEDKQSYSDYVHEMRGVPQLLEIVDVVLDKGQSIKKLTKEAKDLVYKIKRWSDTAEGIESGIHNARSKDHHREEIHKVVRALRRHKVSTIVELAQLIKDAAEAEEKAARDRREAIYAAADQVVMDKAEGALEGNWFTYGDSKPFVEAVAKVELTELWGHDYSNHPNGVDVPVGSILAWLEEGQYYLKLHTGLVSVNGSNELSKTEFYDVWSRLGNKNPDVFYVPYYVEGIEEILTHIEY
jgi:hypothetical protein